MWALGLRNGRLFKRIFGAQSPQLGPEDLERFAASFALNRDAKRTTLRQFRQFVDPQFFAGFDAMWRRLGSERVPARVLWGDGDPYLSADNAHKFGSSIVTILPGVGHWVPLVAPDQLAAEVAALP
jgi:haloalkane dehalogenase